VKRDQPSLAEYHLYSLVLYTLRLRLATPFTKGESSVACVLRHVLRNRNRLEEAWAVHRIEEEMQCDRRVTTLTAWSVERGRSS
jgi:hypothetical protein